MTGNEQTTTSGTGGGEPRTRLDRMPSASSRTESPTVITGVGVTGDTTSNDAATRTPTRAARIADDVYLSVHDFDADRSRLRLPILEVVVTGGLLAELVLAGKATVGGGRLMITDAHPSADPLIHRTLAAILSAASDERDLAFWLDVLGPQSVGWIAARLVRTGVLVPTSVRRRLSDVGLGHAPARHGAGSSPAARLAQTIAEGTDLDEHERCLAALLYAAGLTALIATGADDSRGAALIEREIGLLPDALGVITREVRTAVTGSAGV
ncbi:GPP34 family phosphoprotein [Cryptosporangium phraense]|uniref:GPP34 family phosphoprotein n=1 Tax=Cryptosporangium phraense TaxID=2593070 RepID=A0A545AND8_9ACTN|nr:GPP34 family phosphoprotein [Cryptosporangium phraense]TQS42806.1 GPP34 family phosphoprotein [Cryptosporangium phraense]